MWDGDDAGVGRRALCIGVLLVLSIGTATPVVAQVVPPGGWLGQAERGVQLLTPPALPTGAVYILAVFGERTLDGADTARLLNALADRDAAVRLASTIERRSPLRTDAGIRTTARLLRDSLGSRLLAVYHAQPGVQNRWRVVCVLASSAELLEAHAAVTVDVLQQLRVGGDAASVASSPIATAPRVTAPTATAVTTPVVAAQNYDVSRISSNVIVRKPAPRRTGIVAGGTLVPGVYAGKQVYSDDRRVRGEMQLRLFGNGEYAQQWIGGDRESREGQFAYDPATGRIDLEWGSLLDIVNSRIEPDVDFAVLGRTDRGEPVLIAEEDRGFSKVLTALVRVGPVDRPLKAAEAAAEAEAARYKYVVAPGRGVQDAQIAAIHLHSELVQSLGLSMQMGVTSNLTLYLLLTDGTVHQGLRVPADELDVPTSRRMEPETWGRWRRQGTVVQVAWNAEPQRWVALPGDAVVQLRNNEELRGRFAGGESSAAGDVSSFSLYGVTFGPGRTFETDSRGGAGTGSFTQTMSETSVQTTRDDDGSVTSVSTPGAVGSVGTRGSNAARTGTYRIQGWTLEARYRDGRVVRQPAFSVDGDRDAIYWQGRIVVVDKVLR